MHANGRTKRNLRPSLGASMYQSRATSLQSGRPSCWGRTRFPHKPVWSSRVAPPAVPSASLQGAFSPNDWATGKIVGFDKERMTRSNQPLEVAAAFAASLSRALVALSNPAGCTCAAGFSGKITKSTEAPFYEGSCVPAPWLAPLVCFVYIFRWRCFRLSIWGLRQVGRGKVSRCRSFRGNLARGATSGIHAPSFHAFRSRMGFSYIFQPCGCSG